MDGLTALFDKGYEDKDAYSAEEWEIRLRKFAAAIWNEGFDAGERDVFEHQSFNEDCVSNPYGELCHCGGWVASVQQPDVESNHNMVDSFCADCIAVRCDAYPGACRPTPRT